MNKDYAHSMQDDLISRQDAIDVWWHDEVFFGNHRDDMTKEQLLDYITDVIGSLPSEVVMCKDCKHGEYRKDFNDYECHASGCGLVYDAEFYCADAERREP